MGPGQLVYGLGGRLSDLACTVLLGRMSYTVSYELSPSALLRVTALCISFSETISFSKTQPGDHPDAPARPSKVTCTEQVLSKSALSKCSSWITTKYAPTFESEKPKPNI